jgi:16S rRNA (guanine966-N2)-methyltransferase
MDVGEQRMRIVAGQFRGRRIEAPKGESTRPTTDRVREALFSTLTSLMGPELGGGRALDAFAGSGALGLEALSRGMAAVTFIERERGALGALKANIAALGAETATTVVVGDAQVATARGAVRGAPFALLLLDPPYRLDADEVARMISQLIAHDLLEEGAVIVYEHATGSPVTWPERVSAVSTKRYGSTEVHIGEYERGAGST